MQIVSHTSSSHQAAASSWSDAHAALRHEYTIFCPLIVFYSHNLGTMIASRNAHPNMQPCRNLAEGTARRFQAVPLCGDYRIDMLSLDRRQSGETRSGMTRFALVLAAVLILTLSAGLTPGRPEGMRLSAGAAGVAGFQDTADALRTEMAVMKRETPSSTALRSPGEEPPAPALLIYLGLILVGSTASVALARRRLQRGAQANHRA
jgi:hypothetical protein